MHKTLTGLTLAALLAGCGTQRAAADGERPSADEMAAAPGETERRPARRSRYLQADADRDGVVTRAEIETEAEGRFARLDADRDGVVSTDELSDRRKAASRRGGEEPSTNRPLEPFSKAEYVTRARQRFDRRDRDGDGRLEGAEL